MNSAKSDKWNHLPHKERRVIASRNKYAVIGVIHVMRNQEIISYRDIGDQLDLTPSTVYIIVSKLIADGVVKCDKVRHSTKFKLIEKR